MSTGFRASWIPASSRLGSRYRSSRSLASPDSGIPIVSFSPTSSPLISLYRTPSSYLPPFSFSVHPASVSFFFASAILNPYCFTPSSVIVSSPIFSASSPETTICPLASRYIHCPIPQKASIRTPAGPAYSWIYRSLSKHRAIALRTASSCTGILFSI